MGKEGGEDSVRTKTENTLPKSAKAVIIHTCESNSGISNIGVRLKESEGYTR